MRLGLAGQERGGQDHLQEERCHGLVDLRRGQGAAAEEARLQTCRVTEESVDVEDLWAVENPAEDVLAEQAGGVKLAKTAAEARDLAGRMLGISAIGKAFLDRAQQVYAISIPIPTVRFKPVRAKCEPLLLSTVKAISAAISPAT